jgi:multiple sugar transport system permease protein
MGMLSNVTQRTKTFLSGRRGRDLREYLTAYSMITPAMVLIFTFGIFPVLFAVYVSLHKWKIKKGDFLGLTNFARAVDNLAYLLFFALALGLIYFAVKAIMNVITMARENKEKPWLLLIPATFFAATGLLFTRYATLLLPEILSIADKVLRLERSRELFIQLLGEAFAVEQVMIALWQWFAALGLGIVSAFVIWRVFRSPRRGEYLGQFWVGTFFAATSLIVTWFTFTEIQKAIQIALEEGTDVNIGAQITIIAAGVVLLFLAWKLWNWAVNSESNTRLVTFGIGALILIVVGWFLIAEVWPVLTTVKEAGDKDLWQGLMVTIYYAAGTIPFQLSIALVLAYMLFQNVHGKEFFRVLFFMPYVTPAVASAVVFNLIFGARASSPINALIGLLGGEHQKWLLEPRGVFNMLYDALGIDPNVLGITLPAGPSLALVVIIIYSIWTYVGYDTVIYLAGLGNISNEINEAAEIDGASRWQIFRHITLPLLSPTTYFLSLIAVIGTFKAFNHIWVLRHTMALGTVDTFSVAIFDEFFTKTRFGYASAMAFVLFAIILALTYVNNKIQGSRVFYG